MTRDPLPGAYRALQGAGSPACPAPERLAALVLGEIADKDRTSLSDHVVSCRRCAADAQILFETNREARRTLETSPRRPWLAVVVAAGLAAAAAGLLLVGRLPREQSAERGNAPRAATVIPSDGAVLRDPPLRFAWPAHPQADDYRLKIFLESGDVVWDSGRVATPETEVPRDKRGLFEGRRSYFWVVEIDGPIQKTRLGPFTFRVGD